MASFTEQNVIKVLPRSRVTVLHALLGQTPTPSCGWTAFCLSIGPSTHFQAVPLSRLLWMVLWSVFPWKDPLTCFQVFRKHTQERDCWVIWSCVFQFVSNCRAFPHSSILMLHSAVSVAGCLRDQGRQLSASSLKPAFHAQSPAPGWASPPALPCVCAPIP